MADRLTDAELVQFLQACEKLGNATAAGKLGYKGSNEHEADAVCGLYYALHYVRKE